MGLKDKLKRETKRIGKQMEQVSHQVVDDVERIARSAKFDALRDEVHAVVIELEKQATELNSLSQIIESTNPASTAPEVENLHRTNEEAKQLLAHAKNQEVLVRDSNQSSTTIENGVQMVKVTIRQQMQALLENAKILKEVIDAMSAAPAVMPNTLYYGDHHDADHDDSDGDHTDCGKAASENPTQSTMATPVVAHPTTIAQPVQDTEAAAAQLIAQQQAARIAALEGELRELRIAQLEQELSAARAAQANNANNANNAAPVRFNHAPAAANEGTAQDLEHRSNRSPKNS